VNAFEVGETVWFNTKDGPIAGSIRTVIEEDDGIGYYVYHDTPREIMDTFYVMECDLFNLPVQMELAVDDMVVL